MHWNRINVSWGKSFIAGPFYTRLFDAQQKRFRVALGIDHAKAKDIPRFERDDKGSIIDKNKPIYYQENRLEDRQACEDILFMMSRRLGVPASMVVQGVFSGRPDKLALSTKNWLTKAVRERKVKQDGVVYLEKYFDERLVPDPVGTVWNGKSVDNILNEDGTSQEPTNWEAVVMQVWDWCTGSKTQKERDRDAQIAAYLATEEGQKAQQSSKGGGGISKGAKVLNKKKRAKEGANTKAVHV